MRAAGGLRLVWRREAAAFLELAALTGFTVAQPVFQLLSGASDYLVFTRVGRTEIVALVVSLVVVPPVVLWLLELVARLVFPSAGRAVHATIVGALVAVFGLQALRSTDALGARGRVSAAVAVGVAVSVAYVRWRPVRHWMRAASPAPVAFAALFLLATPVTGLLLPAASQPMPAATVEGASPVVLVVFDELPVQTLLGPGGEIDSRLFPNFAALAGEATFFRNATTVAAYTMHSVPSILTGRFPRHDAAPTSAQHPRNLFTLLAPFHRVQAFESVTALCPAYACPADERAGGRGWTVFGGAPRLWAHTVAPGLSRSGPFGDWFWEEVDRTAGRPARFERFLASIDGEGTPLHFLHVLLPHAPWRYLPDGSQYPPRDLGLVHYGERTAEAWPALVDHQRHVLQAMYVDNLLGQTVARLQEVGLYERATIVVTADHGVSFQPGLTEGTRTLRAENEHEIAWVPLLVKAPGQTLGSLRDDNAMTVDVMPTIADLAGISVPWEIDGISLVSAPPRGPEKVLFNQPGVAVNIGADAYGRVLAGGAQELARPDGGVEGMFMLGPFPDAIGLAAGAFEVVDESATTGRVEDLSAYDAIDLETGTVPALVVGYLDLPPDREAPAGVAVVVNGTVAAVSGVYAEGDRTHRFAAMVWPGWMHQGANSLELYLLDGGDPSAFRRIGVAAA